MQYKTGLALTTAFIALLTISLSQAAQTLTEGSYDVRKGGTLLIDSDSGSINVESHQRDSVEVRVELKKGDPDDFKVTITQDGDDIKIVSEKDNAMFWNNGNIRFLIKVPTQYNVELNTGGGSIQVTDLNGKVDAYTSGGSINLGRIGGDVDIKTSGGSIRVEDVAGNINAHTSGGSVKAVISKQPTADSRLTTSGGSVTAYLLPSVALDINAKTSGGRVRSEFAVDGTVKKSKIKGTINGGGPELYLKTSGGSVNIKEI